MFTILQRILATLPPWFPTVSPILTALLTGIANGLQFVSTLYQYAKLQTRIATATDGWLDIIAWDYFGPTFPRRPSETDISYRTRILAFLLLPRATIAGITAMLIALTGRTPAIIEPAINVGGWDIGTLAFDTSGAWSGASMLITAFRPPGQGIPNVDGLDGGSGGFDAGAIEWTDISQVTGQVTDAEITQRVRQWVAAGVNYTLTISS